MGETASSTLQGIERQAVQRELEEIAGEFETLATRLRAVHASLPVSPREDLMLLGEEDPDYSCIVRGATECAMNDHLRIIVETLLAAAKSGAR